AEDDSRRAHPPRRVLVRSRHPRSGGARLPVAPSAARDCFASGPATGRQVRSLADMPPTDRLVISFAAEPPQEGLPYGRWAETLKGHLLRAVAELDTEGEDIGELSAEIAWFPDRTYADRTYIPAVTRTSEGYEVFGFVSFAEGSSGPADFAASA